MHYIVYSHTDYLDVLKVQTDHVIGHGEVTLFLNKNDKELSELYSRYDRVIFYDDSVPYASRVLSCLESIESEYFLFLHDIDILLNVDDMAIVNFENFLFNYDFDRIDLKHSFNLSSSLIIKTDESYVECWEHVDATQIDEGVYLVKAENPNDYIYNVNPSIWKKSSFVEILSTFKDKTYRNIEGLDVQTFCMKYNIFKMYSKNFRQCGWFCCLDLFKFLHIAHHGNILPLNDECRTPSNQSYQDVAAEYKAIYEKYDLGNAKLKFAIG